MTLAFDFLDALRFEAIKARDFDCAHCGRSFHRKAFQIRANFKKFGKEPRYCSRDCAWAKQRYPESAWAARCAGCGAAAPRVPGKSVERSARARCVECLRATRLANLSRGGARDERGRFKTAALLLALFAWVFAAAPAAAQVGVNYGQNPTVGAGASPNGSGVYPNYVGPGDLSRIYDALVGGVSHSTWWPTIQPACSTETWTNLDALTLMGKNNDLGLEYTNSGVPACANATLDLPSGAALAAFGSFTTDMMARLAGQGRCFAFYSIWNEANNGTYWVGPVANMIGVAELTYSIVKPLCPSTIVLSPSITSGVNNSSSPYPNNPFLFFNQYVVVCTANCDDALNIHGYPFGPSLATADATVSLAPELLINSISNLKAVAAANGLSALPLYVDEGYACSDPTSTTVNANTAAYAACQAVQLLIAATNGIKSYANSFYGVGCAAQNACGNIYVANGPTNLAQGGLALRSIVNWLAGATNIVPAARTQGTNLITQAPNDAGVTVGNLAGSGTGCTSPPGGTGSLGPKYSLSATASIAGGMSYYVVSKGTTGGLASFQIRICGTDTGGANSDIVWFDNLTGSHATVGQNVVFSVYWALAAGTVSGIKEFDNFLSEYTSAPASTGQFMTQGMFEPVGTAPMPIQTRYVVKSATAAFARPGIVVTHYQNLPVDVTITIAVPEEDVNSTVWSGTLTKNDGGAATFAWAAAGTPTMTAPAGAVDYRDVFGNIVPVVGGTTVVGLTQTPILFENTVPKFLP